MKNRLIMLLIILAFPLCAAPWYNTGENYIINIDPNRLIRYIEMEWQDAGANAQGRLYLNGASYGAADVGSGAYWGQYYLPDLDRWDNINAFAMSAYVGIENASVEVFNHRVVYLDYYDIYNSPWYWYGYTIMIAVDPSKIIRYIEVDWRNNGIYTTGTLYGNNLNYGARAVGDGSWVMGYLYLPSTGHWDINATLSTAFLYIAGGAAQIFGVRVVYNETNTVVSINNPTSPGGTTNWSYPQTLNLPDPAPTPGGTFPSYPSGGGTVPTPAFPYSPYPSYNYPIPSGGHSPFPTPR